MLIGEGETSVPVTKRNFERLVHSLEQSRSEYDNVPYSDGRFLKDFVIKTKRKRALELGSSNGYSAIWIGMGMKYNEGVLHTIEINSRIFRQCKENIRLAGLENSVNCINGNATEIVGSIQGNFDFLFLDLGPVDMLPELMVVEPRLTDDAIIALHNTSFERCYQHLLQYAASRKWAVEKRYQDGGNGFGFFVLRRINARF